MDYYLQGNHECEIAYGGEADLHKHLTDCMKNPSHDKFIPVNNFNLDHLPSRYRDVIMLEVIKALSALTVLIKVNYTSPVRPRVAKCFPGQYPFYNTRGSDVLRTGTGRVCGVVKYTESDNKGTCPCGKCQHSDTPSKVWGEVGVLTATHVVFDNSEARQTKCVVGFDDNKSPGVSLDGWTVTKADCESDRCMFKVVSCDIQLINKLYKMWLCFEDLCFSAEDKYAKFDDVDKLTVIVSHPHGCPKQVSVGQWKQEKKRRVGGTKFTKYIYTTATCPGSSGAPIYTLRADFMSHAHSGTRSKDKNYSGECEEGHSSYQYALMSQ